MPKTGRQPAMSDVAALAGVSHQTVSRVLNGHPNVKEQTRNRVQAAIVQLGYRPNSAARALVPGRSRMLGIIAQNSTLFGPASLMSAFEQAAAAAGFAVSIASVARFDQPSLAAAMNRQLDQRVAGIAVIAPVAAAAAALEQVADSVPLVAVDGDPERSTALVTVDQELGARLATEHLLAQGHSTVWHVAGPEDWFDSAGRVAGWQAALQDAGAEVPPPIRGDWSAASGYRCGQMLSRMSGVTAVFAANDQMALGVLRALSEKGIRVPEDVSVIGFDDVPEAGYFIPPLTTVRPDFDEVGRRALALLLDQFEPGVALGPSREVVAPRLIERSSVGPPGRR